LPSICVTHDGLLHAPRLTAVVRGQEGGGGDDNLEPPTAAAWAMAVMPAVVVCHNHCWYHAASVLLRHCRCYFFVEVQLGNAQLGGGIRQRPAALSLIPLLNTHSLIVTSSHPDHFTAPVPYHYHCPPICAHPTTFCWCLLPLLIVKFLLVLGDCQ
jgi:hypothetical protein